MVMNEALEARVVEQLDSISTNLADLDALYHGVLDELENAADKTWMSVATLDYQLPVCLSGIGILPYRQDNVITRAVCFFAIIPEVTETKIVIGALKGHDRALEMYLRDESSTAVLGRLESWMCHGSDHWFMTPSAWNAIPQPRKSAICERILDPSPSIADPIGFSVLDGVRKHIMPSRKGNCGTERSRVITSMTCKSLLLQKEQS
jgi:hypothetical protein